MQKKKQFKRLLASTLAAIITLSILNVLFLSIPASAEYTYGVQYAKDDDTFYFATETRDNSTGLIVSPLGYFCSFYDGTTGEYLGTVFVTDRTEGRAYYSSDSSLQYRYRIPRADIDARMKAELNYTTQKKITELQASGKLRIVFDTLLSIAYVLNGNLYPGMTLAYIPTYQQAINAVSAYNGKGGNFNSGDSTGLFVYTNKDNKVGGAYPSYARNCSLLYVSSTIHQTTDRKGACLGGSWDITFSKSLYNSYYWLRSDCNDSYIRKVFTTSSQTSIPNGYFSVPTPPNSKIVKEIPVDLYPTSVTYWTSQTGGSQVTNLVEGGTYWPRFTFHNNGSIAVTAQVNAWSYPLNNWEVNNVNIVIGANSDYEIMGDYPITINNGLYYRRFGTGDAQKYDTYEYNQNTIVHDWSITLTDSKATESNPNNNWSTCSHKFSPKQPDISQWIIDRENAASSWITNAVNNRIIYSGEQTNSQVRFTNISSFKLQINEYFKALLGLNNNPIANYSKTDDPTWHNSGEVWDRETGTFRAKNTENGTNKTLYLRASAGERSLASAMGINIDDANHITENINLNKQVFFDNQNGNDAKGNTVSVVWDNNARTLTLNGTAEASFIRTVGVSHNFKKDETYKVTIEYVSGSIKSKNNSPAACFAFDVSQNSGSGRIHADVLFPNCQELGTEGVCTSQFTLNRNEYSISPWIWVNDGSSEKMAFSNYKVKIKIENITSSEKLNTYSTNLEGYSVYPTDLETSEIGLYDAETGERLSEDVKLKAGQQVYSETTYNNNTKTAVAVSLETKHDNNTNTEYYTVDESDMTSSITTENNEIPLDKLFSSNGTVSTGGTYTYDKNTGIVTLNGKYTDSTLQYVCFPPIDYSLSKGERYRLSLEYVSGSVENDSGVNYALIQGTTDGDWYGSPYYDANIPYTRWNRYSTSFTDLEVQPINNSMSDARLIIGIWCASNDISLNNLKLKVSIKKVNPSVSWDEENETLTVSGDYSKNRNLYVREISPSYNGTSSDGKVRYAFSSSKPGTAWSELTVTFNGTIYGSDYLSALFRGMNLSGGMNNLKAGDKIRISSKYVGGSVTEPSSTNFVVLPISQYDSNGTRHSFVGLPLPKTSYCDSSSTSSIFTISSCDNLTNDYLQLGLYSKDTETGAASYTTFNNYTIRLYVEVLDSYDSVNNTIISENMSINEYDNYLLRIKNTEGSFINGNSSIVVEYLNSSNSVVSTQEISIPDTDEVSSIGIAAPDSNTKSFRLVLKSDTGSNEKIIYNDLKLNLVLKKKAMTQCNIASDSNSEHVETCVIAPNESVTVRSSVFTVSAVPHNHITLSSYIYIKGLINNTEYEYNESNNTKSTTYIIETPFKPTVVQANSEYRRGITVITSFTVKNDSLLDFGTQSDIDNIGLLSANLKVYKNSSFTGTPIANVNCTYAVPGHGKATIVWFEWTVPTDSPDKLYAEMICDDNNIYSSSEFTDNEDNSKNAYCTFNIAQPKVMSTPDTTFAKKAPYWYEDGVSSASVPSKATGLKSVYNQEAEQIKGSTSWSYYVANGDSLELITETATLMGSSVELIPDGTLSAYVGYDNKWNIKSGYGFKIYTEFKDNIHSTNVQSGYAVFPEFLYKVVDDNTLVNGYTNGAGTRVGFEGVLNKYPLCGGEYATYSTFENTKDGKLILPNNDSSHTPTHFIPIWYPNSDYRINCYVADCWTPGGMLSGEIRSSALHINGNMYDDYRVSEK